MKILIIDRDDSTANLIKTRLDQLGVESKVMAAKNEAIDSLVHHPVDMVFLDPSPLNNARQLVISIRRKLPTYVHVVLMGPDLTLKDAMAAGANDVLVKPFVPKNINDCVDNARRLLDIQHRLNDPDEDFPSGGGVISKSAFCQLFLSAIDRADRYAEQSYVMFLSLRNYNQIKVNDSEFAANTAGAMLAQQLARIRRQSDILAQTGKHEYALLLQRPVYPTEPVEAAMRFADTLTYNKDLLATTKAPVDIMVSLVEIPSGHQSAAHEVTVKPKVA